MNIKQLHFSKLGVLFSSLLVSTTFADRLAEAQKRSQEAKEKSNAAKALADKAQSALVNAKEIANTAQQNLDSANSAVTKAQEVLNNATTDEAKAQASAMLKQAKESVESAKNALAKATTSVNKLADEATAKLAAYKQALIALGNSQAAQTKTALSVKVAAPVTDLGVMATHLGLAFPIFGKLVIATCYVAGIGFGLATAYKFKQYKDNPTQIPIGTPLALFVVSVLLVFMPGLIKPAAVTLFGSDVTSNTKGFGVVGETKAGSSCLPGAPGCT